MTFKTVRISEWAATCDVCSRQEVLHTGDDGWVYTSNDCKSYLRRSGWSFGKTVLCSTCNKASSKLNKGI